MCSDSFLRIRAGAVKTPLWQRFEFGTQKRGWIRLRSGLKRSERRTITSAPLRSPRPGGTKPHRPAWLTPNKEDKNNIQEAKSNELMAEFYRHRDEIMAESPDDPKLNHRNIFESWAIQKIAGLQCVVLDLVRQVDELKQKRQRR
jgi:hypothetical protein